MNSLSIKKSDNVLVIAGKDKGKTGIVLAVNSKGNTVLVKGINMVSKHTKPKSAQESGGIVEQENKINVSNVQVICASCNKATRVAYKFVDGKKIRVCKKCDATLDVVSKKAVKSAAKKAPAKKAATTTVKATKKAPAKKTTATKTVAKKAPVKKTVAAKITTTSVKKTGGNK